MCPFHRNTSAKLTPLRRPLLSYIRHWKLLSSQKADGAQRADDVNLSTGSVEAFLDLEDGDDVLARRSYSAGYRLIETGEVVCAVKLPAALAESAILGRSKTSIVLTPAGQVEALSGAGSATEQVDSLVARTVADDNLRMEEATSAELEALLHRLECSVGLVKQAIARLTQL